MTTYIRAREHNDPRGQSVLYNAVDVTYIEVQCSEITGASHVLRARFGRGTDGHTKTIHSLRSDDPIYPMAQLVLPYLRECVIHAIAMEVPLVDEVFLGICLDRWRGDAAAVVMAREIVAGLLHNSTAVATPMVELSRYCWHDWSQITAFELTDGAEIQQRIREQVDDQMALAGRPPAAWSAPIVPHWFMTVRGMVGEAHETWKIGGDITVESRAGQWVEWWTHRRGRRTSWDNWWQAFDTIVGEHVLNRPARVVAENLEELRHLDLGPNHVGANVDRAVVQPGPVADDRAAAAVPHPNQQDAADALNYGAALFERLQQAADARNNGGDPLR